MPRIRDISSRFQPSDINQHMFGGDSALRINEPKHTGSGFCAKRPEPPEGWVLTPVCRYGWFHDHLCWFLERSGVRPLSRFGIFHPPGMALCTLCWRVMPEGGPPRRLSTCGECADSFCIESPSSIRETMRAWALSTLSATQWGRWVHEDVRANPGQVNWFDFDWQLKCVKSISDGACAYCGAEATGLDHIVPVSKGGENVAENLVPACTWCNSSKGVRTAREFAPRAKCLTFIEAVLARQSFYESTYQEVGIEDRRGLMEPMLGRTRSVFVGAKLQYQPLPSERWTPHNRDLRPKPGSQVILTKFDWRGWFCKVYPRGRKDYRINPCSLFPV